MTMCSGKEGRAATGAGDRCWVDDKAMLTEPLAKGAAEEAEGLRLSDLDNSHIVEPVCLWGFLLRVGEKLEDCAVYSWDRAEGWEHEAKFLPHAPSVASKPPSCLCMPSVCVRSAIRGTSEKIQECWLGVEADHPGLGDVCSWDKYLLFNLSAGWRTISLFPFQDLDFCSISTIG